jgi:hypothetical protein
MAILNSPTDIPAGVTKKDDETSVIVSKLDSINETLKKTGELPVVEISSKDWDKYKYLIEEGDKKSKSKEKKEEQIIDKLDETAKDNKKANDINTETKKEIQELNKKVTKESLNTNKKWDDVLNSSGIEGADKKRRTTGPSRASYLGRKENLIDTEQVVETVKKLLLGPLNLVIEPIEKMFKIDILEKLTNPIKKIFEKKEDINKIKSTSFRNMKEQDFNLNKKIKKSNIPEGLKEKRNTEEEMLENLGIDYEHAMIRDEKGRFTSSKKLSKTEKINKLLEQNTETPLGEKLKITTNPSINDVSKTASGQALIWYYNITNKKQENKSLLEGFKLGNLGLGAIGTAVAGFLSKGLGIGAIVGSLLMFVMDGIKGFFISKKWGVSQLSGVIGGVLGGMGEGIKGAFNNMGKWALMGAGIGTLIMPIVGTIAGGLIGAAIGGILGWIGGKNISQAFDKLGLILKPLIDGLMKIGDFVINLPIIKDLINFGKVFEKGDVKEKFGMILKPIVNLFTHFGDLPFIKDLIDIGKAFTESGSLGEKLGRGFGTIFNKLFEVITTILIKLPLTLTPMLINFITTTLPDLIKKGLTLGKEVLDMGKTFATNLITNIIKTVEDLFSIENLKKAGDFLGNVTKAIGNGFSDFIKNLLDTIWIQISSLFSAKGFTSFMAGGKKWEDYQIGYKETWKKEQIDKKQNQYEADLKLLELPYKNKDINKTEYDLKKKELDETQKREVERINGLRKGGIAKTPGWISIAENEPEVVIPQSKIEKGFDNKTIEDIFRKGAENREKDTINYTKELVEINKELLKVMKDKNFSANITTNNIGTGFDSNKLRFSPKYGSA